MLKIKIIGGGLAGSEAAWQAASQGVPVELYEMRPVRPTAVHKTDQLAELVCSNSFRGDKLDNAVGLLKKKCGGGSLVMQAAESSRVPGRGARRRSRTVRGCCHRRPDGHPLITIVRQEVAAIPTRASEPVIVATGPLTSERCRPTFDRSLVGTVLLRRDQSDCAGRSITPSISRLSLGPQSEVARDRCAPTATAQRAASTTARATT
jgi:tRNA:m(5)U-54 methyltransferase